MKVTTLEAVISRLMRRCFIFMPRSNLSEQTRKKSMRSRCFESILAWILKINPENLASSGSTIRTVASRGFGAGAQSINDLRISSIPMLYNRRAEEHGREFVCEEFVEI